MSASPRLCSLVRLHDHSRRPCRRATSSRQQGHYAQQPATQCCETAPGVSTLHPPLHTRRTHILLKVAASCQAEHEGLIHRVARQPCCPSRSPASYALARVLVCEATCLSCHFSARQKTGYDILVCNFIQYLVLRFYGSLPYTVHSHHHTSAFPSAHRNRHAPTTSSHRTNTPHCHRHQPTVGSPTPAVGGQTALAKPDPTIRGPAYARITGVAVVVY